MNRKNSNGPSTVPCGTSVTTRILPEVAPSTSNCWVLSVWKSRIHLFVVPLMPLCSSFTISRSWGKRSKADQVILVLPV